MLARIVDIWRGFLLAYLQGENRNSLTWAIAFEELSFDIFGLFNLQATLTSVV